MQNIHKNSGFTLIKLIAIVSIIGFMLFFSIPRLQESIFIDQTKKVSRLIMLQVRSLKERAVSDNKLYTLHISIDKNRMWVTNESMSEDEIQNAEQKGYDLSGDVKVLDVEYPVRGTISSGTADIFCIPTISVT